MLSHKITDGKTTKTVSEFAWGRKYSKLEKWKIVDTKGKATESVPPSLPPTKFQPPALVELRAKPVVVENGRQPSDPIGIIAAGQPKQNIGGIEVSTNTNGDPSIEATKGDGALIVEMPVDNPPAAKKMGRPKGSTNKAKATA